MSNDPAGAAPRLMIVSAPSGAGKTTLCRRLLADFPRFSYSVSCTTRAPRPRETDGVDYHFLDEAEFERRAAAGEFVEHALVHGHRYGTLAATLREALAAGRDVLLDIDVQGADLVRRALRARPDGDPMRRAFLDVFIAAPSLEELRRRLVARGQDAPETIERRLRQADAETARSDEFMFCIVNDRLGEAHAQLRAIVLAAGLRRRGWL